MKKNQPSLISTRIAERVLPPKAVAMQVDTGSGKTCDGCDELIERNEPQIVLSWHNELGKRYARLHLECYSHWQQAIR